ncbi:hypothetical protein CANCADRAFT_31689 [Tortispora caseinolytica NRRL Y-17796]|uniref:Alpha-methylacyl-CoA racemase n=1 Tax=Tortispora caseinolytica NRRL Y-17796 TaxID=767744 RepID=A0A1E4TGJ8_9ASCO|nr:hypothetical protein CANCADRAFT_31689 [Tortispora caseinolytica NRRL Y-17796]
MALNGIKVAEFAGLAPAPMCGLMLADYGADVIRIDRAGQQNTGAPRDHLVRGKRSIAIDLKSKEGIEIAKAIVNVSDVLLDPYRPGVLERLGLGPDVFLGSNGSNPDLIYCRLTGFGQTGKYSSFAGHDINYIAASGVVSLFGPAGQPPSFPSNILGDFAGLALPAFANIVLQLYSSKTNTSVPRGKVLDINIVDSVRYLALSSSIVKTMNPRPYGFDQPRGLNMLEGGAPYYRNYATATPDRYMSVGSIEPQFYALLLKGLELDPHALPNRENVKNWSILMDIFERKFRSKPIEHWIKVFTEKYPDACCVPVEDIYSPENIKPIFALGDNDRKPDPSQTILYPGENTTEILKEVLGKSGPVKGTQQYKKSRI